MPATPSLANFPILAGIAVSFVATYLFAAAPSSSTQTDAAVTDGGHAHKGDRLPLFHVGGRSFTVSAPSVRQRGATDTEIDGLNPSGRVLYRSDTAANNAVALKNVTVVGEAIDVSARPEPLNTADPETQDPSQKPTPAQPVRCEAVTRPGTDPILSRLTGRCFA
jgi:hypothetical protein